MTANRTALLTGLFLVQGCLAPKYESLEVLPGSAGGKASSKTGGRSGSNLGGAAGVVTNAGGTGTSRGGGQTTGDIPSSAGGNSFGGTTAEGGTNNTSLGGTTPAGGIPGSNGGATPVGGSTSGGASLGGSTASIGGAGVGGTSSTLSGAAGGSLTLGGASTGGRPVSTGGSIATGGTPNTGGTPLGGTTSSVGSATNTGGTAAKKPNGSPATLGSECVSNIVADGVCCDKQCTGCNSCSGSPLTAGAVGQCSYVVAGQVAHNACTASGTTCGLDGKCDGAGACRYSPAEGSSCDDSSNLCITGRVCQSHVCTPGTTKTCNTPPACKLNATCSAGACNYTQNAPDGTTDSKCPTATPYCYAGGCYQCKTYEQCGVPTPSCHPTTHTCVCRIPSSTNLLKNPGFEGSFSGWDAYPNSTGEMALANDSEGCAGSNSVYVENSEYSFVQCIPLDAWRTYDFGGRFNGGEGNCNFRFYFFDQLNCAGTMLDGGNYWELRLAASTTWQSQSGTLRPPAGTLSAQMHGLFLYSYIDQLYLNASGQF